MNQNQNRSLTGAAEAIEKSKNGELGDTIRGAYETVSEGAQHTFEDARDALTQASYDAYDLVGESFRAGEDYARRKPLHAMAAATAVGLVLGYVFAVRTAPRSASRAFSRWG
jgi:ElaB/YqjD/DUF883 family membrane-anchored ribosome-binding protein